MKIGQLKEDSHPYNYCWIESLERMNYVQTITRPRRSTLTKHSRVFREEWQAARLSRMAGDLEGDNTFFMYEFDYEEYEEEEDPYE